MPCLLCILFAHAYAAIVHVCSLCHASYVVLFCVCIFLHKLMLSLYVYVLYACVVKSILFLRIHFAHAYASGTNNTSYLS